MPRGIYKRKKGLKRKPHTEETKKKIGLANSISHKGMKFTEEHKKKIGESNMGRIVSEETRKKIGDANRCSYPFICDCCGKECITKLSDYQAKKKHFCSIKCYSKYRGMFGKGENSNGWKGGITPENQKIRTSLEYTLWRKSVFERDNFTCQKTGERGGKLVAHHINNFAEKKELRLAIDNGITLSDKTHKDFHKKYGIKNNTIEQLEEFLIKVK